MQLPFPGNSYPLLPMSFGRRAPPGWPGGRPWARRSEGACRPRKYTAERVSARKKNMADKPSKGLADVVAASTALSDIDGQAGRLFYRGYDNDLRAGPDLRGDRRYLLQRGSVPSAGELNGYRAELAAGRTLGSLGAAPRGLGSRPASAPWRRCAAWSPSPAPTTRTRVQRGTRERAEGGPATRAAAGPDRGLSCRPRRRECVPADPGLSLAPISCSSCMAPRQRA